jgi:hypothetical protein
MNVPIARPLSCRPLPTRTSRTRLIRNPGTGGACAPGQAGGALAPDNPAAAVVRRNFAEFLAGAGILAIAEGLTRDGIPCPSAHDPGRNKHRSGIAWSKGAIRVILANPRYTGRQVWNRQRKDEVLIDVADVALGNVTKTLWNVASQWIWSEEVTHPPHPGPLWLRQRQSRQEHRPRQSPRRDRGEVLAAVEADQHALRPVGAGFEQRAALTQVVNGTDEASGCG